MRLGQEPGYNVAEGAQLAVVVVKVRASQLGNGKDILPVRNRKKDLFFYPVTVGQYAPLMTTRATFMCLAAEGEQVIMAVLIAVDACESLAQVAAVDKPGQRAWHST
jgi:hypothetical protein